MSPVGDKVAAALPGRPRVSGDEPVADGEDRMPAGSTPRERG